MCDAMNNKKNKKNVLEQQIDNKKCDLKRLPSLEEETIFISRSINRCINLLNSSAKGEFFNKKLNNISDDNINDLRKSLRELNNQKEAVRRNIKKLQDEIDNNSNRTNDSH